MPKNTETFTYTLITDIPPARRIELDDYAFDTNELLTYLSTHGIKALEINPHPKGDGSEQAFTGTARDQMRAHPALSAKVTEVEAAYIAGQKTDLISDETLFEVQQMLFAIFGAAFGGGKQLAVMDNKLMRFVESARGKFLEYLSRVSEAERKQIMDYYIELPWESGTQAPQKIQFKDALMGGSTECVIVMQLFLWQFVVTLRPEMMRYVPKEIIAAARNSGQSIGNRSSAALTPAPANAGGLFTAMLLTLLGGAAADTIAAETAMSLLFAPSGLPDSTDSPARTAASTEVPALGSAPAPRDINTPLATVLFDLRSLASESAAAADDHPDGSDTDAEDRMNNVD